MNYSDEFRRLAERFRRIQADNPSDGQRQIIAAMAWGAKLVKRAAAAGIVELPPGLSRPTPPTRPSDDDSELWAMVWFGLVEALQVSYPDELPSNAGALKWQDVAPGIRRGAVPVADWRLRSENYATAADWLARYVTTAAGGAVETSQPSDAGPERAGGPAVEPQDLAAGGDDDQDAAKARYPTPDNYERDKWIFEQRQARRIIREIQDELSENKHGWEPLYSVNGIRDAADRYAKHLGIPTPKARPGKPRGR